ncbi:neutral/alkaline non-lysosomal ceramidase N-terminal domain-containing protein [bacterium]|nr:neutral/alkaline non-lysosomal ceramidase N-terminal domain-containing protein [bacterium]
MSLFRASATQTDLEPWPGVWMTGYGARTKPAEGTHDPIMARALMMDADGEYLVIVSCDLLGIGTNDVNDIRRSIHQQTGIPEKSIMITGTHTHSGPATQYQRGVMGMLNPEWLAKAKEKITEAVCTLPGKLEPATFSYAKTKIEEFGYNRADKSRSIDEDFIAFSVDSWAGTNIATLINFSTHAVTLGPQNLLFSGDFPGAACRKLGNIRGGIGMYLAGAGGDADPIINRDRGWGTGTFEDVEAFGNMLARKADELLNDAQKACAVKIKTCSEIVDMPMAEPVSDKELTELTAKYESAIAEADSAGKTCMESAMLQWANDLKAAIQNNCVPKTTPIEIFAAKINDFYLVGVPVEAYSDIALAVKADMSPAVCAFVGYANGLYCYIPAKWEYEQGGYAATAYRWFEGMMTGFCEDADSRLVSAILKIFSQMDTQE